ncbi:DNA polymerase/3'-5' exonuclease PolX [Pseudomonas chlororaphis]|uniref:DNA polymerase/3'-5' exonuclease PolX n=1 Tax=Pseudomonas chlororaphis TaxID=587753 RepID=UPI0015DFF131|nr:DNA polymerase/3'-5' exonuclease PolX [Pseudomonas chlororaphis]QLL10730.1 DNA polymerase/3'-5' exonuclease PolX [Pseudomonas chlororaphis subsp. aurantiaca]
MKLPAVPPQTPLPALPRSSAQGSQIIDNDYIAAVFDDIADLLEIEDANIFRIRAYRNAARTLRALTFDLAKSIARGESQPKLSGIGVDLAGKINEIVGTGDCSLHQRLRSTLPPGLVDLLSIAGLGPKRVKHLYHDLGVENVAQLCEAARQGRIRHVPGFGEKMEARLLLAAQKGIGKDRRSPIAFVAPVAQRLTEYLQQIPGVEKATVAGSLRRMRDTVGDIDILVAAQPSVEVVAGFISHPEISTVLVQGHARASVTLGSGTQVDLRVVEPAVYGAALVYFTGSKAHNIALRQKARRQGFKLSEYGVFKARKCVASATEAAVYHALGLPWITPELREDRGEIAAAQANRLPRLIEPGDLKGDLHAHTLASDGGNSLEQMALAARAAGLEYLAITEHSRSLRVAHGLDADRLLKQIEQIDALNANLQGITLLKGIEVDILEEGSLDLPDDILGRLDLVVGAVHSHFGLTRRQQTQRLLRAMDHRYFTILAHPLCRLINERAPLDVDLPAIIKAASQRGCCLELNAQPQRMDLFDLQCQYAKEEGVLISINSDAHRTADFTHLRYGVAQARRAWLKKNDVLNTRSLIELKRILQLIPATAD